MFSLFKIPGCSKRPRPGLIVVTLAALTGILISSAASQDRWSPFDDNNENYRLQNQQPAQKSVPQQPVQRSDSLPYKALPPGNSSSNDQADQQGQLSGKQPGYTEPLTTSLGPAPAMPAVERGDLAPVMSPETELPFGLWQGLTVTDIEQLVAPLQLPAASAALQHLWLRILAADEGEDRPRLSAVRAEALFRSGRLMQAARVLNAALASSPDDPLLILLQARTEFALGNPDVGCRHSKSAVGLKAKLPKPLRGEAVILAGYCAIIAGNKAAAGLTGELARDEGYGRRFTLAVLAAIASGEKSYSTLPKLVRVEDYLLLKEAGFNQPEILIPHASPGLLSILIKDATIPATAKLLAAEKAARLNIIGGHDLAEIYRQQPDPQQPNPKDQASHNGAVRRAHIFQTAENFPSRLQRTRMIRQLIDDAQREGLAVPIMTAVHPIVAQLRPASEIGWFAATAIEVMLAAADYDGILPWLALAQARYQDGNEDLQHWRVLADMANPASKERPVNLQPLEYLTQHGRLRGGELRRLTTVLDALGYNVPIPVWDAANQTPSSMSGNLPPTGILTQLLAASEAKETARTALLVLRTLNGSTATDAHLIALGDAIRGLKRAGLEADARRLAFEAVFAAWPRPTSY
ncbi:MAG: hypothetical protein AAFR90_02545 [Pseudomonadota bacterium]